MSIGKMKDLFSLSFVGDVFVVMIKIFSIAATVYSVVRIKNSEIEEGEDKPREELLADAKKEMRNTINDEIKNDFLPEWADIFTDTLLEKLILELLSSIAENKGFFETLENTLEE